MELYQLRHIMTEPKKRSTTRCYFLKFPEVLANMGISIEKDFSVPGVSARITEYHREDGCVAFEPDVFIILRQIRSDEWKLVEPTGLLTNAEQDLQLPHLGSVDWFKLDVPEDFPANVPAWKSPKNTLVRAEVRTCIPGLEARIRAAILRSLFFIQAKTDEWSLNRAL